MNLADMLSYADIHQLNRIARHYACDCNPNSKRELIQSILNRMNRKDVFERCVEQLSVEDIRFLNSLIDERRDAFSLEELLARAQLCQFHLEKSKRTNVFEEGENLLSMKPVFLEAQRGQTKNSGTGRGAKKNQTNGDPEKQGKPEGEAQSPREIIAKFARQGWLFHGYSHQTKDLYHVPEDLKRRLGDTLAGAFRKRVQLTEEPPVYRDEQNLLAEDITRFLTYLMHHPVELTADGTMYKRTQQAIMDSLAVKEQLIGKGGWRFGYGRKINEYPNRFSLIYDYCYYNGLMEETPGGLLLTDKGKELVCSNRLPDPGAVYRFWLKLYKNPIHNLQSLVFWLERLAGRWVSLKSLGDVLAGLIRPYYYDTPESILKNRIVMMMMHQGLLRLGEHPEAGAVIEMTRLGKSIVNGTYVPDEERIVLA